MTDGKSERTGKATKATGRARAFKRGSLTILRGPDPFADDPPGAGEFYEAVGRYIRVWGELETNFNATLLLMINHPGVRTTHAKKEFSATGPVSFKQRVELWRKLVTETSSFRHIRAAATHFSRHVGDANTSRNNLLHKAWQGFVRSDPLTIEATSWRLKAGRFPAQTQAFSLADIRKTTKEANVLVSRLGVLTMAVVASYPAS